MVKVTRELCPACLDLRPCLLCFHTPWSPCLQFWKLLSGTLSLPSQAGRSCVRVEPRDCASSLPSGRRGTVLCRNPSVVLICLSPSHCAFLRGYRLFLLLLHFLGRFIIYLQTRRGRTSRCLPELLSARPRPIRQRRERRKVNRSPLDGAPGGLHCWHSCSRTPEEECVSLNHTPAYSKQDGRFVLLSAD